MSSGASTAAGSGPGTPSVGGTQQERRSNKHKTKNKSRGGQDRSENSGKPDTKKFVGKEGSLSHFIYQITSGNDASDQYTKTTEEIIRFTATKFKNGGDVERSLFGGGVMDIPMPIMPAADDENRDGLLVIWKIEVTMVLARRQLLEANLVSAYALIQGQCSDAVLEKVRAQADFVAVQQARDPNGLLRLVRSVMFQYDSRKHRAMAIIELTNEMVSQSRHMSDSEFLEKFRTKLSVIESAGGTINIHHGVVDTATPAELARAEAAAKDKSEALLFLARSDQHRYGKLVQELANDYNKGRDCYPSSLTEAYELMLHDDRGHDNRAPPQGNSGVSFSTVGGTGPITGTNAQPNPRPDITCHRCSRTGHFSNSCAEVKALDGTVLVTEGVTTNSSTGSPVVAGTTHVTIQVDEDSDNHGFQVLNDGAQRRSCSWPLCA